LEPNHQENWLLKQQLKKKANNGKYTFPAGFELSTETSFSFQKAGCFYDERRGKEWYLPDYAGLYRIEETSATNDPMKMTLEMCAASCWARSFLYMGVQNGKECICGDSYNSEAIATNKTCSVACNGNSEVMCGGFGVSSVYFLSATIGEKKSVANQGAKVKMIESCDRNISSSEDGRWNVAQDDTLFFSLMSCALDRYNAQQARELLANSHVIFVGDSLTRYQYLSLVYFIEHGVYLSRSVQNIPGEPSILR
jgi:hypothetical protein